MSVAVLALGLAGLFSSCSKSSSGATGAMFIESCTLSCSSNGATGGQISCGVINTTQNQEIGVLFSKPVQFSSVSKQSFQVSDAATGTVPPGTYLIDPFDSRRVIFRPSLTFDTSGNPVFGFQPGASYTVIIPGTKQGDSPPFIRSTGGTENATRLSCAITTQGIGDPVAGPPAVAVFVDTVAGPGVTANGAVGVLLTTKITMVFNDLMNIGTLVIPGTGQSPTITVKLDPDGNVANTLDQVLIQGSFTFNLDQVSLQTTVVFTPSNPFPSAGSNLASPRKVIVNLPVGIKDLTGNSLGNAGPVLFTPQFISFPPVLLPPGGEQFTTLANCDQNRTGAFWGEATAGRLTPGLGGGSGRLGDLKVAAGEVRTLHTSPTFGTGFIKFNLSGPLDGDTIDMNGVQLTVTDFAGGFPGFVEFENQFPALTLNNLVQAFNNSPDPLLAGATFSQETGDTLRIDFDTAGATGTSFTFDAYKIVPPLNIHVPTTSVIFMSGPTIPGGTAHLLDGVDQETFAAGDLLDNFDYQASPGGTPNPINVADGIFEFATVNIETGGVLRFDGSKPARLLVRGKATLNGLIDASGESKVPHPSDSPPGQLGGRGGPNAGKGGAGADRPDNTGSDLMINPNNDPFRPFDFGVVNPGGFFQGRAGTGVGQIGTIAAGPGGTQYPSAFPSSRTNIGSMQTNGICESEQVGGAGGGGGYSLDGGTGVAQAVTPVAIQGASNTPPDTAGGDSSNVGLEPPGATPNKRKLTPEKGFLKGGSGGGGGGGHVSQTKTNGTGFPDPCISGGASINRFRSHSGGAGGGGGGAIQFQAGRSIILAGGMDATGGFGGGADNNPSPQWDGARLAAPGGGGSGGAILLQARTLLLSAVPSRMSIAGGAGGVGFTGSLGGHGGAGLARVEAATTPSAAAVAAILDPIDPLDPNSINYLSVGTWVRARQAPASFQGGESCWMRPTGAFFSLQFADDAVGDPGWDMDLILNFGQGDVTVPYRAPNGILPGQMTYEQFWGQLLDRDLLPGEVGAPVIVRFQGAKLSGQMPDPCNVDISGPNSPLSPGSLTPWVRHPSELNNFPQLPDMIRFVIIFDASKLDFQNIVGVTNVHVKGLPN
ncbi:MAG TPA: Ig-like domain-containing protein [Planctomycetota bacterium]|nr:Ig-like domain-containing protein [Planctomycetota bacterium]